MLEQGLDYVVKLAKSKKQMLDINPMQYFIRLCTCGHLYRFYYCTMF